MLFLALALLTRNRAEAAPDFDTLYRDYRGRVGGFFKNRQRSLAAEDVEDLVHETFLRVHGGLADFKGEAKPGTWIFSIARNVLLNRHRTLSADKRDGDEVSLEGLLEAPPDSRAGQQDAAEAAERRELLHAAIGELPPKMRLCVELRIYQEMSFADIAKIVGVTESTAKSQVSRAVEPLRQLLAAHYPGARNFLTGEDDHG